MARAGLLNTRVTFQRRGTGDDGYGNVETTWADLATVWGQLTIESGREALAAGRLESALPAVLRVRVSSLTSGVDTACRAVIAGVPWEIVTTANRDQHSKFYEMQIRSGVAT